MAQVPGNEPTTSEDGGRSEDCVVPAGAVAAIPPAVECRSKVYPFLRDRHGRKQIQHREGLSLPHLPCLPNRSLGWLLTFPSTSRPLDDLQAARDFRLLCFRLAANGLSRNSFLVRRKRFVTRSRRSATPASIRAEITLLMM